MDEKLLEIREFTGDGYQPVIDFCAWRVAILNYIDEIHPERIESMERHNETDEVFVMLKGQGILFLGEGQAGIERIHAQVMQSGKIYNVKQSVWHTVVLSRDGSVLIVENRNTTRENSDYSPIDPKARRLIVETARKGTIRLGVTFMEEITFSVFNHGSIAQQNLQLLLERFEQQYGIHVRLDVIALSSLRWPRLVEAALYHSGPDVSEVGNSWVGDLVRMDALRPFSTEEVHEIIKSGQPFDAVWQANMRIDHGVPTAYSIPLSADVRVVFYRRELIKKTGIDEAVAFKDIVSLEKTLDALKERGISIPLVIPNRRSNMTLHCSASWVWAAGGDFLSPDGTGLEFDQPNALEGFKAYFRLVRHLVPEARDLEENEADEIFCDGNAATLLSGYWIPTNNLPDEVREDLGAAPMPGVPFVGGGDAVIWNHSRHESAALKLVQFFHTKEAGRLLHPWFGLPISEADWSDPPFDSEIYQVFRVAIQKGRSFPPARLWGLVEKRLTDTLADIWIDVLKSPETQMDGIVETRLIALARRLQLSMES